MTHHRNVIHDKGPSSIQTVIFHWSLVVLGSISLSLNSLFAVIFIKFRKKFLSRTNNKILLSMTLADSLVGVSSIVFGGALITNTSQQVYQPIGVIPLFGSMFTSMFSTSIMTLDRLVAIRIPLRYKTIMTPKRVIVLILLCWIIPAFIVTHEVFVYVKFSKDKELQLRGYILAIFFILGSAFLTLSNLYLYRIICKHAVVLTERLQTVRGRHRIVSNTSDDLDCNLVDCTEAEQKWQRELNHAKSELREIKMAKFCIRILSIVIICWLPLTLYRFSYSIGHRIGIPWLHRVCLIMVILNSVVNPIMYLLTRQSFQKYMWNFLRCKHNVLRKPSVFYTHRCAQK